ncbi:MAG: hypothetical protein KC431_07965, partial [Myxococcales bacterium]|nr:hypothetical protein [Myxococcales bacterium]
MGRRGAAVRTRAGLAAALASQARRLCVALEQAWGSAEDPRADASAQALAYGLLTRRWLGDGSALPRGLRELIATSRELGEAVTRELDALEQVLADTEVTSLFTEDHDPSIHFFQHFLDAYDPSQRANHGVWSTPDVVVDHLVQAVDEAVISDFGLPLGLADSSSWAELAARTGVKLPAGVDPVRPVVCIVDPATGTGTFLRRVIARIRETMVARWRGEGRDAEACWQDYVDGRGPWRDRGLRERLFGVELMLAPHLVAQLCLDEATLIHGNTLEDPPALRGATVILGNPPYSIQSANLDPQARQLIEAYKYVDGHRIVARGALQLEKNLQDDYVKFFRWAEQNLETKPLG